MDYEIIAWQVEAYWQPDDYASPVILACLREQAEAKEFAQRAIQGAYSPDEYDVQVVSVVLFRNEAALRSPPSVDPAKLAVWKARAARIN